MDGGTKHYLFCNILGEHIKNSHLENNYDLFTLVDTLNSAAQ